MEIEDSLALSKWPAAIFEAGDLTPVMMNEAAGDMDPPNPRAERSSVEWFGLPAADLVDLHDGSIDFMADPARPAEPISFEVGEWTAWVSVLPPLGNRARPDLLLVTFARDGQRGLLDHITLASGVRVGEAVQQAEEMMEMVTQLMGSNLVTIRRLASYLHDATADRLAVLDDEPV